MKLDNICVSGTWHCKLGRNNYVSKVEYAHILIESTKVAEALIDNEATFIVINANAIFDVIGPENVIMFSSYFD